MHVLDICCQVFILQVLMQETTNPWPTVKWAHFYLTLWFWIIENFIIKYLQKNTFVGLKFVILIPTRLQYCVQCLYFFWINMVKHLLIGKMDKQSLHKIFELLWIFFSRIIYFYWQEWNSNTWHLAKPAMRKKGDDLLIPKAKINVLNTRNVTLMEMVMRHVLQTIHAFTVILPISLLTRHSIKRLEISL